MRARADAAALSHLYDEAAGLVYSLALRITGNEADAEEVTVDVFKVWRTVGVALHDARTRLIDPVGYGEDACAYGYDETFGSGSGDHARGDDG